ncbi:MAG TPA: tRNA pseudouridine(55) synthase TruB, partial [Candidatus Methylacidiphilales bacterium]|nr:tRNA pseudouridine(55) synthase TruB [Candidatus Methylacidiphilales bacterium]
MEADGVLLIDKPTGCTSHDVVDFVRRRFHFKKVGHCGTLDPLATGLLMLVIGKATKIQDLLMAEDKEYAGTMKLGATTDSQDSDGKVLEEKPVPALTPEQIDAAFRKYVGDFYQTPPMVSALKKDGVPLYKLARAGKTVEREARLVHINSYKIEEIALPLIKFRIECSKGFYVRTYCHDIGQDLGCGAHL